MHRRTLLAAVGATAPALAGCGAVGELYPTETPAADELPDVTATYRVGYGLADVRRRILTVERDAIAYEATCRDEGGGGVTVEDSLDPKTYERLQRHVLRSRPERWREHYRCHQGCADDAVGYSLSVTVDGEEHGTGVDGLADPPNGIEELHEFLSDLREPYEGRENCETER